MAKKTNGSAKASKSPKRARKQPVTDQTVTVKRKAPQPAPAVAPPCKCTCSIVTASQLQQKLHKSSSSHIETPFGAKKWLEVTAVFHPGMPSTNVDLDVRASHADVYFTKGKTKLLCSTVVYPNQWLVDHKRKDIAATFDRGVLTVQLPLLRKRDDESKTAVEVKDKTPKPSKQNQERTEPEPAAGGKPQKRKRSNAAAAEVKEAETTAAAGRGDEKEKKRRKKVFLKQEQALGILDDLSFKAEQRAAASLEKEKRREEHFAEVEERKRIKKERKRELKEQMMEQMREKALQEAAAAKALKAAENTRLQRALSKSNRKCAPKKQGR